MHSNNVHANHLHIGNNVEISPEAKAICDSLSIGDGTVLKGSTRIQCQECVIGNNNYLNNVWIEGSLHERDTRIQIGKNNIILHNTRLNCNDHIEIGDDVNIGQGVTIWTHASSMSVLDGHPFTKAPVKIGSHVWITGGTTILPGIKIGSNVVIGNSSLVNKDVPSGCFAAGIPIRIIKENIFPKKVSMIEKSAILKECINEYQRMLQGKSFSASVRVDDKLTIEYIVRGKKTVFDCATKKIRGEINIFSEDFRDFLRHRGIKFFIDKPFKSIPPKWFSTAKQQKIDPKISIKIPERKTSRQTQKK